jgi:hypothetical protein
LADPTFEIGFSFQVGETGKTGFEVPGSYQASNAAANEAPKRS